MAIEYARLYPDTTQLQAKNGANLTDGYVLVFLAGTDDPAVTYSDFNGTRNPQRIVVDDNGRFTAIVDKSKAYRVEVYDANGMLLWTAEPVWCTGNSGAGISTTRVISTDGSISVDESVVGSQRTYDIGIAPSDSDEFLEWVKCADEGVSNGDIFPTYVEGTMETMGGQGLHVGKDRFYHGTVTIKVVPTGTGINYETLSANLKFGEDTVVRRNFDIDNSLHDSVVCEFSYDFKAPEDGYLYLNIENVGVFSQVDVEMQVHRIYSGINAVPDTCATKQWVQETFDYNLSGKIGYSALEYNPTGEISGISGSAIATTDPARVSAIASSYAESAVSSISAWSGYFSSISSKADQSAFEQCCEEVHSALEEVTNNISSISSTVSGLTGQYIEQSASGMFQPSGHYVSADDMSAYVPFSGLEGDGSKITGISGSAIKGHEYTGINPVVVDNVEDTISVEHKTLAVDSTMTAYNSGSSAVIGVNVDSLNLSAKMDASASSLFYPADNPSGFISGVDLTPYQLTADMSAYQLSGDYAYNSSLADKLDASASSQFAPSGDYMSSVSVDSNMSGDGTTAYPLGLNTLVILSAQGKKGYVHLNGTAGSLTISGDTARFQGTGNNTMNVSFNCKPSAKGAIFIGPWSASNAWAGFSAQYSAGNINAYLRASGSGTAGLTLWDTDGSAQMQKSSIPYWNGKQDASAMTAYQEVSGMTAYQPVGDYQPSGDYIQESALGWVEV